MCSPPREREENALRGPVLLQQLFFTELQLVLIRISSLFRKYFSVFWLSIVLPPAHPTYFC